MEVSGRHVMCLDAATRHNTIVGLIHIEIGSRSRLSIVDRSSFLGERPWGRVKKSKPRFTAAPHALQSEEKRREGSYNNTRAQEDVCMQGVGSAGAGAGSTESEAANSQACFFPPALATHSPQNPKCSLARAALVGARLVVAVALPGHGRGLPVVCM